MTSEAATEVISSGVDVKVLVAIIAASAAVFTVALKEALDWLKNKWQQEQKLSDYAKPFSVKANELFWRLNEIVVMKRHQYLSNSGNGIEFYDYKLSSSVYRLNCFLAQLKIIGDEVNHLKKPKEKNRAIMEAANSVQKSLADGHHVEEMVLRKMLDEYATKSLTEIEIGKLLPEFGTHLQVLLSGQGVKRLNDLRRIDETEAVGFLEGVRSYFETKGINCSSGHPSDPRGLLASIAYREYYLYRDWQNAIAATMISDDAIMDYGKFEKIFKDSDDPDHEIISRAKNLFLDIDPNDSRDLRVGQIKNTLGDLALLLEKLKAGFPECDIPEHNHLTIARNVAKKS